MLQVDTAQYFQGVAKGKEPAKKSTKPPKVPLVCNSFLFLFLGELGSIPSCTVPKIGKEESQKVHLSRQACLSNLSPFLSH